MSKPNPIKYSVKEMLHLLNKSEVAQKILATTLKGTTISELTKKVCVDHTTVRYHLLRFLENEMIYRDGKYRRRYEISPIGYHYLERIRPAIWHLL